MENRKVKIEFPSPKLGSRRPRHPGERYRERSGPIINFIKHERPGCHTADRSCAWCLAHGAWYMLHAAWRAVPILNAPRSRDGEARWVIPGSRLELLDAAGRSVTSCTDEQGRHHWRDGRIKKKAMVPGGEVRGRGSTALDLSPASWCRDRPRRWTLEGPCSGRAALASINSRPALIVSIVPS